MNNKRLVSKSTPIAPSEAPEGRGHCGNEQPATMTTADAALAYVDAGFGVMPIRRTNKKPYLETWKEFQTRKPTREKVAKWWKKYPDALIGMVTGKINNLTVVDCDNPEIHSTVRSLLPEGLNILSSTTQRGTGKHLFFGFSSGLKNWELEGLDVRTEGGYVIVPPSVGMNGPYVWDNGSDIRSYTNRPSIPRALLDFILRRAKSPRDHGDVETPTPGSEPTPRLVSPITEGSRDDELFHLALDLFRSGKSYEYVCRAVVTMARGCVPPFAEDEALAKVNSASAGPSRGRRVLRPLYLHADGSAAPRA